MLAELPRGVLEESERLYESGRYHTAYTTALRAGLLEITRDTSPRQAVFAGRLLRATGAPRRGRKILLEIWRRHRRHPSTAIHAIYEQLHESPLAALESIEWIGELTDATDEERADWLCARALCLSSLRDFTAAERAWQAAREAHRDAWTWCVRALLDDARDRVDSALDAIDRAREVSRWYRPVIDFSARMLVRARRANEARALLTEASDHLEAASTQLILGMLLRDAGELDGAAAALLRAAAWSPAMEREMHDQIAAQLGYVEYLRGNTGLAADLMRRTRDELACAIADRIAAGSGRRCKLAVPHVPQHHNTCAPATLTAIAEWWGEPADHVEIAEQICHDGTPAGSERKWAEERGFIARQFTVTWDSARALIDAGLPFALTTSFTLGAHLQPVAGYDERRQTLLVADPSAPTLVELDWDRLAESQGPFGPRGLVFVPAERAAALDTLSLPDAHLYDLNHALEMALQRHDRDAARRCYEQLEQAAAPDHYLLHQARRALASYDGDERGTLAWVGALRERFADHPWLRLCELTSLYGHASEERRMELASGLLREHRADPAILVACARFLVGIGQTERARVATNRAIRIAPQLAPAYQLAADMAWEAGERQRATRLYRIASCLADGDENAAWSYFLAANITGDVETALAYLADRVARMQSRSGAPAQTLCQAYAVVGRAAEGLAALDAAIAAHPDDGGLLLVAAEQHRLAADLARAAACLDQARGKVSDAAWRRAAAVLAVQRGDLADALALRRQLVDEDPLDLASQRAYLALLARSGAGEAACSHAVDTCKRFPFHIPLAQLCHEFLRDRAPDAARALLAAFVERQPRSAWALHELADWHIRRGELDEARALLVRARTCAEDGAALEVAEAALHTRCGRRDEAIAHLQAAICIDVDAAGAVPVLLELARDAAEARELLEMVDRELARQGSIGPGLLAYAQALRVWYDPLTTLERLRALRNARGHQWPAWSAEVDALMNAGKTAAAAELAAEATRHFGHDLRAWRQLALVEGARGNRAAQIAALERALELAPHAIEPMRRLADAYLAIDDVARARAIVERALAEDPLEESTHGYLAQVAKLEGDLEAARRHLERGIELEPDYAWAWNRLLDWSDDRRSVIAAARETLARHPTAVAPRLLLARNATDLSVDERVALLDEASRFAPENIEIHDTKAELLARHERWEEALAACRPAFWGESPPNPLCGRAAWVRFQRGEHEAAIDDMLATIRRTPSYEWGIHQLLAWGKRVGAPLRTAKRLVEVAAESAFAHAALGEAHREAGELDEAEASFARALEIDGTQHLARLGLFDVRYERGKYDSAEPLLNELDRDHPYVMARRVQLLAATRRLDEADAELARMLRQEVEDPTPIAEALSGYRTAREGSRFSALLDRLMGEPDAPRAVAVAWWDHVGKVVPPFRRWRRIKRWPVSEATRWAAMAHVEQYGELGERGGLALFTVFNFRRLRSNTELWGSVGYCLVRLGHSMLARWWLADYERRDSARPWMLNNLARTLAQRGAIERALAVCRRAIQLPRDHTSHRALLLVAPVDALDDPQGAARALSTARLSPWNDEDQFLGELAGALLAYATSARDSDALDELTEALARLWSKHRARPTVVVRKLFGFVTSRLARRLGRRGRPWLREVRRLATRP